jgi:hypothetical protein
MIIYDEDEHGEPSKLAVVRLSKEVQEVLMFTNETSMTQVMRHLQTEYNEFCKEAKYYIEVQVPTWNENNFKEFSAGNISTLYGISASVDSGSISLFTVSFPIYIFSVVFQFVRYRQYCTPEKKEGLYKQWLGPDFSRWMEYLFTSIIGDPFYGIIY